MALVKCKECGNIVSTDADHCPACGTKKFDETWSIPGMIMSGLIAMIILTVICNNIDRNDYTPKPTTKTTTPTAQEKFTLSPQKQAEITNLIQKAVDAGLILRIDLVSHKVFVDPLAWALIDVQAKENISVIAGLYLSFKSEFKHSGVDIIDNQSGKRLAKSGVWGFKVY